MPDPIVQLVEDELAWFREVRQAHSQLFPGQDGLYPIPFFGDIRRASTLSLSLNPSWKEFAPARRWLTGLDSAALATRLLHYFDLPFPECYPWFQQWEKALLYCGCSYERDAAHVDLSSCPTLRPTDIPNGDPRRVALAELMGENAGHLLRVLRLCPRVRIVIVIDYEFVFGDGGHLGVFETFRNLVGNDPRLIVDEGNSPPVIRGNGPGTLPDWLFKNRHVVRERLENGEDLRFG